MYMYHHPEVGILWGIYIYRVYLRVLSKASFYLLQGCCIHTARHASNQTCEDPLPPEESPPTKSGGRVLQPGSESWDCGSRSASIWGVRMGSQGFAARTVSDFWGPLSLTWVGCVGSPCRGPVIGLKFQSTQVQAIGLPYVLQTPEIKCTLYLDTWTSTHNQALSRVPLLERFCWPSANLCFS